MAYDGLVVAATVSELNKKILNGTIVKVAQPEKDELLFTLKVNRKPVYLRLSANASVPFVCLETESTLAPVTAPAFCMALRKHIGSGRILSVEQAPGLERIIIFSIEHLDELGDRGEKKLVCELMGRHSNIILLGKDDVILDSIKHVSALTSSVREVFPGRTYFVPETTHKGLGRTTDEEIAYRAGIDSRVPYAELTEAQKECLANVRAALLADVSEDRFEPNIVYERDRPVEFSAIRLISLEGGDYHAQYYGSMSEVVRVYYEKKATENRVKSRSEDIRQVLKNLTERNAKKLGLQEKQLADTEKRDQFRLWGELLNAFGYGVLAGKSEFECENYYENTKVRIPLDPQKTPVENAKKYFDRYGKLKRTREALLTQVKETSDVLYHLGSLSEALSLCEKEADLKVIRDEMAEAGFLRWKPQTAGRIRKEEKKSEPLHFVSSDGLDIYVGRNNEQNEELDFKTASPDDWWFHAKKIPGSHVIVKTGKGELPDKTVCEAASLAAYYSQAGKDGAGKVEVDYVRRRELKKVPGAPKGFVVYHTNYSIMIEPQSKL